MITFNDNSEKIPYEKSPISIEEQVQKLKSKGLVINDEELAARYLSNISYYRLRAYTYPFQDNSDPEKHHEFLRKDINFKDIIDLYCFDRRLRFLVFNALEKVEVALRAKNTIASTKRNKLFAYLCCIKYILDIVSPDNDFLANLQALISQGGPLLSLKDMGFPDNWKHLGVWK